MQKKYHFVGIGGSGMSALAQFRCMENHPVSGSDRLLDHGKEYPVLQKLKVLGATLFPQDGSGITENTEAVITSTAIEEDNPDIQKAHALQIPIIHRSEMLANYAAAYTSIVVAGTSGKSTVTAMIYEILAHAGLGPSVITGAGLNALTEQDLTGNAYRGSGSLLVIEGDESDGTLVRYKPKLGLILNLDKDHKELDELHTIFNTFAEHTKHLIINGDRPELCQLMPHADTFGTKKRCTLCATHIHTAPNASTFSINNISFEIPTPGLHNIENALGAIAASLHFGVSLEETAQGLRQFKGVARRFQIIGCENDITVIDDFAHNPAKLTAALKTAQLSTKRVLAVYQPHGYGPTKFLKEELIEAFIATLRNEDQLYMPEIYYAGGTATKNISSEEITDAVCAGHKTALFKNTRDELIPFLVREAQAGDIILVMGARDPGLPLFCKKILDALT